MEACAQMPFTYEAYRRLLSILKERGYEFKGYHDYGTSERPVILRHDIDFDPAAALAIAELEAAEGVRSTYFVLLRTGFYNCLEHQNVGRLRAISALGHDMGLHFDETQYEVDEDMPRAIRREADMLQDALGVPVESVSMHRPSKAALEASWDIPGIVNSYATEFFEGFEYVSDSRRRWRKPIMKIVEGGGCRRLHVLTHPFWYGETDSSLEKTLGHFVGRAADERMSLLEENFTDLDAVVGPSALLSAHLALLRGKRYRTDRLVLRPLRPEDAADMFEYTSNPEVSKFLNWEPHRYLEESKGWIASKLSRHEPRDLLLGVELCELHKLIGVVRGYNFDPSERTCEISYVLNPAFQGHGYMGEALRKLIGCLEEAGVDRIVALIDKDNTASAHVVRRLGMEQSFDGDFTLQIKGANRLQHTYVLERRQ